MRSCLSELPNDILHRILKNLTNKDAIQLSLVSKELLNAVQSRSILVFNWRHDDDHDLKYKELEYMISTLTRYDNERIHLEFLELCSSSVNTHQIDQCIQLASSKNMGLRNLNLWLSDYVTIQPIFRIESLVRLDLRFVHSQQTENMIITCPNLKIFRLDYGGMEERVFENIIRGCPLIEILEINSKCFSNMMVLTQSFFHIRSLVQLDLKMCDLRPAESMIIRWPNLKGLRLHSVHMEERVFENILRGCPLIEFLEIDSCYNFSELNFKDFNLGYLKKLDIWFHSNQTFELAATSVPNLECLVLRYSQTFGNLGKYGYHKLKSLRMSSYVAFNSDFFINLAHQFPVLEELSINHYAEIENIKISSPSLKKIKMASFKGLQEASFDVPNLVLFTFKYGDIPNFSFIGNPSGWTSRITFGIFGHVEYKPRLEKLKEFLATINASEASISIDFKEGHRLLNIKARAQKSASFPRIILCLNMMLRQNTAISSLPFCTKFMFHIVRMFRPQEIMLDWQEREFPKVVYDLLTLPRFDNVWNVSHIYMHVHGHQRVTLQQVSNREKFLELFKSVDDDEKNKKFTLSFHLKYYPEVSLDQLLDYSWLDDQIDELFDLDGRWIGLFGFRFIRFGLLD